MLSLVDDYSRRVWTILLKTKDETCRKFVEWKTLVEKQSDKKLKNIRPDNDLEFLRNAFKTFCEKEGIQ